MTDQGYPAPPPPPPPAPQFAPPPPPPPPAQPAYAPQPPAQPPRKKKRGALIAGILAVLFLCIIGSCIAIAFASGAFDGSTKTIEQAETHFDAATTSVDAASAAIKVAGEDKATPADVSAAMVDADKKLRTSRDEIAAARASIESLKDSQGKTDYLASLDSATLAIDALQDVVAYLDDASGMLGKVEQGGTVTSQAMKDLNASITAGNRSSYSTMRSKGTAAAAAFAKAAILFGDADKVDTSAGLSKATLYCNKRKAQADIVVRMADEGRTRKFSAYNADAKRMNAIGKQAEAIGEPAIISDPNWAEKRLSALIAVVTEAGTKTDQLHTKALDALGYTAK
jgi:hypothetical protein